jgi:hypothetical protein
MHDLRKTFLRLQIKYPSQITKKKNTSALVQLYIILSKKCAFIEHIVTCFVTEDAVRIVNWFIQQSTTRNYN